MDCKIEIIKGFSCPKKYLVLINDEPFLFFNCESQAGKCIAVLNGGEIEPELENLSKFVKSQYSKWNISRKIKYDDYYNLCKKTIRQLKEGYDFLDIHCGGIDCDSCPFDNSNSSCYDKTKDEYIVIAEKYIKDCEKNI